MPTSCAFSGDMADVAVLINVSGLVRPDVTAVIVDDLDAVFALQVAGIIDNLEQRARLTTNHSDRQNAENPSHDSEIVRHACLASSRDHCVPTV